MLRNSYHIGFPLYHNDREWIFVLVHGRHKTTTLLKWHRNQQSRPASTRFLVDTGAYNALIAKPRNYLCRSFHFQEVANSEHGEPVEWHLTSDTAACVLALAQSHHGGFDDNEIEKSKPIVLISCAAAPLSPDGGYQDSILCSVSDEEDEDDNLDALEKKWQAVVGGRAAGLRVIALVLHVDDANLLARRVGVPAIPLADNSFRSLAQDQAEQPVLIKVGTGQLPLLARALGIPERDFSSNPAASKSLFVIGIMASVVIGVYVIVKWISWDINRTNLSIKEPDLAHSVSVPVIAMKQVSDGNTQSPIASIHATPGNNAARVRRKESHKRSALKPQTPTKPVDINLSVKAPRGTIVELLSSDSEAVVGRKTSGFYKETIAGESIYEASRAVFKIQLHPGRYDVVCKYKVSSFPPTTQSIEVRSEVLEYETTCAKIQM